jgi:hypothetical protein
VGEETKFATMLIFEGREKKMKRKKFVNQQMDLNLFQNKKKLIVINKSKK